MRRGTDVVVGTPGRVKDFIEKGTLKLEKLMCASLYCFLWLLGPSNGHTNASCYFLRLPKSKNGMLEMTQACRVD